MRFEILEGSDRFYLVDTEDGSMLLSAPLREAVEIQLAFRMWVDKTGMYAEK